jgi:hypothetical protein
MHTYQGFFCWPYNHSSLNLPVAGINKLYPQISIQIGSSKFSASIPALLANGINDMNQDMKLPTMSREAESLNCQ